MDMTREEAIAFGKMWLEVNEDAKDSGTYNFFKISIKALEQEPGKIDRTAARLTNLTVMARLLTTEELLELRKIVTKELLTRPDYMRKKNCPICDYPFDMCQCRFSGTAHPDRYKRARVVADHIYLLSDEQIEHLKQVQKQWSISYGDKEMNQILKELKGEET